LAESFLHASVREIVLRKSENIMLESIAIILLVLWALGLVTSYTLGGFIHVLLVLAIVVIAIRVIQGRRVV
jgi:hypothetical protein